MKTYGISNLTIRKLLRFRKKANGAELTFRYTPLGEREVKKSQGRNGGNQYYIHDPNGNIIATYGLTANRLIVVEQSIYGGSGRLGIFQKTILRREEETFASPQPSENYTRRLGHRQYELTDHLGNVHATLLDRKLEKLVTNGEMGYSPEMYFYTDYYPFGFPMPKRFGRTLYRYGFNGQEKDNEIYGEGQSYTAEFWQYDARLGRRWNVDPKPEASLSQYSTFANNPIWYSDLLGDFRRRGQAQRYQKKYGGVVGYTNTPDERGKWYVAQEVNIQPMLENISWNDILPAVDVSLQLIFESPSQERRRLRRETRRRLISQESDPVEKLKIWSDFTIGPVEDAIMEGAAPVLQGAVLINPLWNATNTISILLIGYDAYGNEADNFDKISAGLSVALPVLGRLNKTKNIFGLSDEGVKNLGKVIKVSEYINIGVGATKTTINELDKENEK